MELRRLCQLTRDRLRTLGTIPRMAPLCAGCGVRTSTTREHLIHGDVARMLVANFDIDGASARRRLPGAYARSSTHPAKPEIAALDPRDGVIKDLLCATCNSTWAQDLESRAARHLHAFFSGAEALDAPLVVRWLAFLSVKVFAYHRSVWTREEPFGECLSHVASGDDISRPGVLYVARGDGPLESWMFQSCLTGDLTLAGKRLYSAFALRGFAWVLRIADPERTDIGVETHLTPATPGLRVSEVAAAARAPLAVLGLPNGRPFQAAWFPGSP